MTDFDKVRNRFGTNSFKWDIYNDPEILGMGTADMDFESPKEIVDALVKRAAEGSYGYEYRPQSYYDAIIGWYQRKYGWEIKKEWLSNVPGVFPAMHLCIDAFTEPGDAILVHEPYFPPIKIVVEHSKRKFVTDKMIYDGTQYKIDFASMEKVIIKEKVKAFIMINPHNPSGRVFSKDELRKIGALCAKYKIPIISDEVHANITYDGNHHYPACMVSDELNEYAAILTAPSKAFNLQSLTYSVVIIPNEKLKAKFEYERSAYTFGYASNVFSMVATEVAYSKCDKWLDELNEYLQGNLDYLIDYIQKNIPKLKVVKPEGTYMVWLDFREFELSPEQLRELLLKNHIGFTYGEEFGEEGVGFERINIGCSRLILKECLERLKAIFA